LERVGTDDVRVLGLGLRGRERAVDLVDDVLNRCVCLFAHIVATFFNLIDLVLQELNDVGGLFGCWDSDRANQTMTALIRFGKLVGQFYDILVEVAQRLVLAVAAGVQVHRMSHVAAQKQLAYELRCVHCMAPSGGMG
jgi:hypothetical protein